MRLLASIPGASIKDLVMMKEVRLRGLAMAEFEQLQTAVVSCGGVGL